MAERLSSYLSKEWGMMPNPDLAVVTGAFSYTGRYVTRRLLDQGVRVRTLTRSPDAEDPFGGQVEVAPLDFSDPDGLYHSMQGAGVFYNAYWVRYAHGRITIDLAGSRPVKWCKSACGTRMAGLPLTSRSRTPGCCSRLQRGLASAG